MAKESNTVVNYAGLPGLNKPLFYEAPPFFSGQITLDLPPSPLSPDLYRETSP